MKGKISLSGIYAKSMKIMITFSVILAAQSIISYDIFNFYSKIILESKGVKQS